MASRRPSMALWRPSVALWRPSVALWRPSMALWRPSMALWRPSMASRGPPTYQCWQFAFLPWPALQLKIRRSRLRSLSRQPTPPSGTGLELDEERRKDRAVAFLDAGHRRLGLVVIDVGQLQLQARGHGRGQAGVEVVEGVAEVVRFPERRQLLRHLARRRQRLIEVLAGLYRAAARSSCAGIALELRAHRTVDGQVPRIALDDPVAGSRQRRDEVVEILERIAEVRHLGEGERPVRKRILAARVSRHLVDLRHPVRVAAQIERIRL